jgi:hypothetical protein
LSVLVRTKNVPAIEATIATAPRTSGYRAAAVASASVNVRTPSSMTATAVTA